MTSPYGKIAHEVAYRRSLCIVQISHRARSSLFTPAGTFALCLLTFMTFLLCNFALCVTSLTGDTHCMTSSQDSRDRHLRVGPASAAPPLLLFTWTRSRLNQRSVLWLAQNMLLRRLAWRQKWHSLVRQQECGTGPKKVGPEEQWRTWHCLHSVSGW